LTYVPVNQHTETVGVPWQGEAGVQQTTAEIMAAQAAVPAEKERAPRLMVEHEGPDRHNLPQDPNAVAAPTMVNGVPVFARKVKGVSGAKTISNATAPQTVSTPNFTGATLTATGAFPPDTMGAVGPTQFVV